jgi:hypothetical protein
MTSFKNDQILSRFNRNPGATSWAINQLKEDLGLQLPDDYISFLRDTNGGEGFIGPNAYIVLWRAEDLGPMNKAYQVNSYAPGLLLFGSDGGGEAFAFDVTAEGMPIVGVPFVGMDRSAAKPLAINFHAFLDDLSRAS